MTQTSEPNLSPKLSLLACTSCRRRKIKCDRNLPHCAICSKSPDACTYPTEALKPGPKLGAPSRSNNLRKRARITSTEDDSMSGSIRAPKLIDRENNSPGSEASISFRGHPSAMHEISSILHPSHADNNTNLKSTPLGLNISSPEVFSQACQLLGISVELSYELIDIYMSNFCAFSLFHKPSFLAKIHAISSAHAVGSLLASMFTFAVRYKSKVRGPTNTPRPSFSAAILTPVYFERIASELQQKTLGDCGDESPPLCLVQATVLIAFQQLIRGVRGVAWRCLGACIRLAYELDLHRIDAEHSTQIGEDPIEAIEAEEKRHCWWAIWEMDTFASIIRRSPTAINWSENETFLPIKDEFWWNGTRQASCFLARKPMARWKTLQKSGNESCKAWFIVANSLMRDAQVLSDPRGLFTGSSSQELPINGLRGTTPADSSISEQLSIISNSLRCFAFALPKALKYEGEYLAFASDDPVDSALSQHLHGSKHATYLMIQVTHLMIDHYDAFRSTPDPDPTSASGRSSKYPHSRQEPPTNLPNLSGPQRNALDRFVLAADNAFTIISRCSDYHVQHVNPFLSSSVWVAAAVQLVQKYFRTAAVNSDLVDSKFEFLRMNYKQYVEFWGTPSVLAERLDDLDLQFEKLQTFEIEALPTHVEGPTFRHLAPSGLLQTHYGCTSREPQPSFSSEITGLPQSNDHGTQLAPETTAERPVRAVLVTEQTSAGPTVEEGTDLNVADGSLGGDFGFGLQHAAGSDWDFPIFLNNLFSGSYAQ